MLRRAFTLIELLIVIAIIALLMSILLPALGRAREQSREVGCKSNFCQIGRGFIYYTAEWKDRLPGSTWDVYPSESDPRYIMDWFGVGTTQDMRRAPQMGTIFRYILNPEAYLCPSDYRFPEIQRRSGTIERITSATGPAMISGAPLGSLQRVRYPDLGSGDVPKLVDAVNAMLPFTVVEEDSRWYLTGSLDSAWSNVDQLTPRHRGKGAMAYIDGHAEHRKFNKIPKHPLSAWNFLYQIDDGRFISAGWWGGTGNNPPVRFGFFEKKKTDR